jgi:2-methylisocitrate lyase-like PEP mutase family enzyme
LLQACRANVVLGAGGAMSSLQDLVQCAQDQRRAVIVPGATDTITARVIEELGFEAIYVTGAGLANSRFGYPDVGLITMTEMVDQVAAMSEGVTLPLIVDADTGFGNPVIVQRTVRLLERAGAAGVQIEDQMAPKRCGHFEGKEVIPAAEMVQKIRAAVDARRQDTMIIARTDAAAVLGMSEALDRAMQYREAGADVLFVEAPTSHHDLAAIPRAVPGPHIANMVEGGKTPIVAQEDLAVMGFTLVLYANSAMRASIHAVREVLGHLRVAGSTEKVADRLITWHDRQSLVRKQDFEALEARYLAIERNEIGPD